MKHHDIKSVPAEQLSSFPAPTAPDQEEFAGIAAGLRAQRERFQKLNEFCDRAIAELRASLEPNQNERHQAAAELKKPVNRRRFVPRPKSARAA
jgi:hypothetical protein